MRRRIFYGWVIAATMFVINFCIMATGTLNFGLFVLPMGDTLGMSRSQFGLAQATRRLSGGISSFIIGRLLDRHGPRVPIVASAVITGVCLLGIGHVNSYWQFMVLLSIIGVSGLATPNNLMTSVPVAKWFWRQRGRALALASMGLGVGGIVFLPITQTLIDHFGWRHTWTVLAIIFMAITVPLAGLLLRRNPEDLDLTVDGDPVAPEEPTLRTPEPVWTVSNALRTTVLWKLMLVFGLMGVAEGGTSVHRIPYWIERGFDAQLVSFSFSADAAGSAVMVLIAGWLVDYFPARFVAMASYLGFALAMGLMLVGRDEFFLFGSTITFGLSIGALQIIRSYIFAAYFGPAFLGAIRGIVTPISLVCAGVGAPLVGYLRDETGSYISSWWILLFIYLLSALIMATIKPPKQPSVAPAAGFHSEG